MSQSGRWEMIATIYGVLVESLKECQGAPGLLRTHFEKHCFSPISPFSHSQSNLPQRIVVRIKGRKLHITLSASEKDQDRSIINQ